MPRAYTSIWSLPVRFFEYSTTKSRAGSAFVFPSIVPRLAVPVLCIAIGLTYAFIIVSARVLNPLDTSWYDGDLAQSYLGWLFFRQEPRLVLPLGWSHAIAYPFGESIGYFDSIPIVATAFWFVRNVLPAEFQYHGLFLIVSCILQFYFGFRICRTFADKNHVFCVIGALFFLTAPILTWRANVGHFTLTAQWLILAAIEQFLVAHNEPTKLNVWFSGLLCFIAGGIHPYISAMVLLVLSATSVRLVLHRFVAPNSTSSRDIIRVLASVPIFFVAAIASLLLFGFIHLDEPMPVRDGYGYHSMNLLAPIDPYLPALVLNPQQIGRGQYEGYNYLGFGMITLAAMALVSRPGLLRDLVSKQAIVPMCLVLVCLVLAMSSIGTAGSHVLYNIPLPDCVYAVVSTFRSSGRLFWPAYYLVFAAILAGAYLSLGRYAAPVLIVAFLIQYADLASLRNYDYRPATKHAEVLPLNQPDWGTLGTTHKHLVVLPPWQCDANTTPGGRNGWWLFGKFAADQHMSINSFYSARTSAPFTDFFCNTQVRDLEREGMKADTVYVLQQSYALQLKPELLNNHFCERFDRVALCSRQPGRVGNDLLHRLQLGTQVTFTDANREAFVLSATGWSEQENWGRWMVGPVATMTMRAPERAQGLDIRFAIEPFLPPGHVQRVEVSVAGKPLAHWRFDGTGANERMVHLASTDIGEDGIAALTFVVPDAVSPVSRGLSGDIRPLAIGIRSLEVTEPAEARRADLPTWP